MMTAAGSWCVDGSFHSLIACSFFAGTVAEPGASLAHVEEGCDEGDGDDEEDETHGYADRFA